MDIKIKPTYGRVLVKISKGKEENGGIFILKSDDKKVCKGEVVSIGVNEEKDSILVGDLVYFSKYNGDIVIENASENYVIVKLEEIMGVEKNG